MMTSLFFQGKSKKNRNLLFLQFHHQKQRYSEGIFRLRMKKRTAEKTYERQPKKEKYR